MLRAVINDMHELELPSNIAIRMSNKSPVFDPTKGEHSFPFELSALSPKNKIAIGHIGRANKFPAANILNEIVIYNDKRPLIRGTMKSNEVSESIYRNYITAGKGEFNSLIKGKKLHELEYGGLRTIGTDCTTAITYYNGVAQGGYPEFDFAIFPIMNNNFYDEHPSYESLWVVRPVANYYYNGTFKVGYAYTPFPYLCYVIKQIFESQGYKIRRNFFKEDTELKTLCVYNCTAANRWQTYGGGSMYYTDNEIDLKYHVPDVEVSSFLLWLQTRFNTSIHIDEETRDVYIIKNESLLIKPYVKNLTSFLSKNIKWETEIAKGFKLNSINDSNDKFIQEYFKSPEEMINVLESVADEASLPSTGNLTYDVRLSRLRNQFFIWLYGDFYDPEQWLFYSKNFWPMIIGDGSIEINTEIDTLDMYSGEKVYPDDPTTEWLVPRSDQQGNAHKYGRFRGQPFSARLLFYRGFYEDENGMEYPLGSSDIYDYAGNEIANYRLRWDGDHGIYESFYKRWMWHRMNVGKFGTLTTPINSYLLRKLKNYETFRYNDFNLLPVEKDYTLYLNRIGDLNMRFYKL